ncbi:MAG: hypothetical protein AAFZ91_16140 [Pseudomonadota bacterium]
MSKFLKLLVQFPPLLFALVMGAQGIMWLVNPGRVTTSWGYTLPDGGLGLSSMIGTMTGYSLVVSICLFMALFRKERFWYYPPMMIFFFLGIGRLTAALVHGAPLMPERFIVEFIITGLLYLASRYATRSA